MYPPPHACTHRHNATGPHCNGWGSRGSAPLAHAVCCVLRAQTLHVGRAAIAVHFQSMCCG